MAVIGNDDRGILDHGDSHPKERPLSPGCPPPPALFSPKVRSITPKPTIFSSLGDAHLAITARLVSRSAAQTVPHTPFNSRCGSPVNPLDQGKSIDVLSGAQHMEFATNSHVVNGRCLTGYVASSPAIVAKPQRDKREVVDTVPAVSTDSHHTGSYNDDFDPDRDWMNGPGPDINSIRAPRETGSTVINIYRQYLPSTILGSTTSSDVLRAAAANTTTHDDNRSHPSESSQEYGSERHYVLAHNPSLESVEIGHTTGRDNSGKHRWQMYSTPGDAPSVPLPELPQTHGTTQQSLGAISDDPESNISAIPSADSLLNSQVLLNGISIDDQESRPTAPAFAPRSDLLPPSRTSQFFTIHCIEDGQSSHRGHEYTVGELYPAPEVSQAAFSTGTGGVISESDEDPFQYDRNSYGLFLQRDREREVSAALEHIDNSSIPSPGKQQPVLDQRDSSSSAYPPSTTSAVQANSQPAKRPLQSNNPFLSRLDFYHTLPAEGPWEELGDPNEVRIPVQQPSNRMPAPKSPEADQGAGHATNWQNKVYSEGLQNIVTDGGDWETVGTNVGQFDSNRACASGTGLSGSHLIKVTGSSIADYSDISDFAPPTFDAFASTERILQHPGADCGPNNRVLRNLKETGRPIFLPKPRVHRVNGYPQDSCRIFTDPTAASSGSSARSHLLDKLKFSKRMRRHNETTQEPRFDPYKPINEHPSNNLSDPWSQHDAPNGYAGKGKAKYITGGDQAGSRPRAYTTDQVAMHRKKPGESSNSNKENRITPIQAAKSPATGSPTLFSFPLITLEEAAKKQAIRIANGEDDLTITSGCRTRQDSSAMSSRATQRTTPPTPCISKPTPVHYRNHTGLGFPDTVAHYPGYSFDKAFGGHGRDTSIVSALSSASPPIPGRAVFPRSCRNPFGFSRGSMRNSFSFPNRPPAPSPPPTRETPDRVHNKKPGRMKYKFSRRDTGPRLPRIVDEETAAICYCIALVISVFPFMAVLVYRGMFNSVLSWYTQGEIGRFTHKQRHTVGVIGGLVAALWLVVLAVMVTLLVSSRR
ncbi:hypothetical protein QBC44DRAFT_401295 [Cladorrhinum sp. PSN332]|nr:hypothetical protein QBC44DRAFT_401295 [Cladorrhinum sp. PSN332]